MRIPTKPAAGGYYRTNHARAYNVFYTAKGQKVDEVHYASQDTCGRSHRDLCEAGWLWNLTPLKEEEATR